MTGPAHASGSPPWPALPYAEWSETCETLHLWTQVVGKIRLAQTPWQNHSWHVTLYVTASGLTTSPIPHGDRTFEIHFDFLRHRLDVEVSDGGTRRLPLVAQSVADFHDEVMRALVELGVAVSITDLPCEIAGAVPFTLDRTHATYDPAHAQRFWHALVAVDGVFKRFRTGFIGKSSPVHLFWGSFDLAASRFSGRRAPLHPGSAPGMAPAVMQEAYSHEVCSAGFWPGGAGYDASFYSYVYPEPEGYRMTPVQPAAAAYDAKLGEFVMPYEAVRTAADPSAALLAFLRSTYAAAADAAQWDRANLERAESSPGHCPWP